jgi:SNF2 family DNA or RNA helicase
MKFRRHHGKERLNDIREIDTINIVLTTYNTLLADWNKWKASGSHVMFSVRWKRIVLDEGGFIHHVGVNSSKVRILTTSSTPRPQYKKSNGPCDL